MAVVVRSSAWREFWRGVREALREELWDEVKDELLQRAIKYLYDLINRRREEPGHAVFPDLARFFLPDDETASEAIVFGPRPGPSFRLGHGSLRPGRMMFLHYGVARPRPPPSSIGVDHAQVPDCLYFLSDVEHYVSPEFARRVPRLGPVLACGGTPVLPPPPVTTGPNALPSEPATPPAAPGYMWYWIAAGVSTLAVGFAVLYFARRRRSQRRRAEEQEARRAEQLRLEQEARRAEQLPLVQEARHEADSTTEGSLFDGAGEGQARPSAPSTAAPSSSASQGPLGL